MLGDLPEHEDEWLGFRPTLPDFLPVMGPSKNHSNTSNYNHGIYQRKSIKKIKLSACVAADAVKSCPIKDVRPLFICYKHYCNEAKTTTLIGAGYPSTVRFPCRPSSPSASDWKGIQSVRLCSLGRVGHSSKNRTFLKPHRDSQFSIVPNEGINHTLDIRAYFFLGVRQYPVGPSTQRVSRTSSPSGARARLNCNK